MSTATSGRRRPVLRGLPGPAHQRRCRRRRHLRAPLPAPEMGTNAAQGGNQCAGGEAGQACKQTGQELNEFAASKPQLTFGMIFNGFAATSPSRTKVTAVVDYGDGATGLRHRRPRPRRNRPVRDPRQQGQDRRRRLQDRHRCAPEQGRESSRAGYRPRPSEVGSQLFDVLGQRLTRQLSPPVSRTPPAAAADRQGGGVQLTCRCSGVGAGRGEDLTSSVWRVG